MLEYLINLQRRLEDPYMKAWKEWVERDRLERMEKAERLEKKRKLSQSWELVREFRNIMKENYSDRQERRVTEDEKRNLQEIAREMQTRLEKQKTKKEKVQDHQRDGQQGRAHQEKDYVACRNKRQLLEKKRKQAGAELCQAQVKLGVAKLTVKRNKSRAYLLQV